MAFRDDLMRMNMYRLRSKIKTTFDGYDTDIVLLDSAPGMSKESMLTMRAADEVLFVATPHTPSIIDIAKTCQMLKEEDAKPMGIILNRIKNKTYELGDKEITKFTGLPVIAKIPESDAVLKSTNFKTPVISMHPKDRASRAFMSAAGTLIGEDYYLQKKGLFSRLFYRLKT